MLTGPWLSMATNLSELPPSSERLPMLIDVISVRTHSDFQMDLEFKNGESRESLGLKGDEIFDFLGLSDNLKPQQEITVIARSSQSAQKEFKATVRIDTPVEVDYYRNGGILQMVLRKLARG